MSDHDNFLLVTPEGWTEVQNAGAILSPFGYDVAFLSDLINAGDWGSLSQALEIAGVIESDTIVSSARVVNTGADISGLRLWYQL